MDKSSPTNADLQERYFFMLNRIWQKELTVSYKDILLKARDLINKEIERLNINEK